jgi:hypothetical protein
MKTLARLALVTLLIAPVASHAASPDPKGNVRSQFYIFEGSAFESGVKGPNVEAFGPRQAARFGRLLELKKDLTPGIGQSLKDRAFK